MSMNLLDQVEVLRGNLPIIQRSRVILPMNPDYSSTKEAYRFASLIHPARDIIKKIKTADRGGNILPKHLRGWNVRAKNGHNKEMDVDLGRILNSVMHMSYLLVNEVALDVANDNNTDRYIVELGILYDGIARLLLDFEDICLVSCALTEKGCAEDINDDTPLEKAIPFITSTGPWYRDLWAVLSRINQYHDLEDRVWSIHFSRYATPVGSLDVINNQPFVMGAWHGVWQVGWRRDVLYAKACVDVLELTKTIREHAS